MFTLEFGREHCNHITEGNVTHNIAHNTLILALKEDQKLCGLFAATLRGLVNNDRGVAIKSHTLFVETWGVGCPPLYATVPTPLYACCEFYFHLIDYLYSTEQIVIITLMLLWSERSQQLGRKLHHFGTFGILLRCSFDTMSCVLIPLQKLLGLRHKRRMRKEQSGQY